MNRNFVASHETKGRASLSQRAATERSPDRRLAGTASPYRSHLASSLSAAITLLLSLLSLYSVDAADSDIVINEIMYNPPEERENLQYVEIFNRGAAAVDLSEWAFTRGIRFVFPRQTKIEPASFIVVCRDVKEFSSYYGREIAVLGEFTGKLSHKGDRIELANAQKQLVDWVKYSDHGEWPIAADGYSPSLERISPNAPGHGAENWAPSRMPAKEKSGGTPGKKNDSFSGNLPPLVTRVEFSPRTPKPKEAVTVIATVEDPDGVPSVALWYRTITPRNESPEKSMAMNRISGDEKNGVYSASIEGQPAGHLVRFRIRAEDRAKAERIQPSENEIRPSYSFYTPGLTNTARIPFGFVIRNGPPEQSGASFHEGPRNRPGASSPARGANAFIYLPPGGGEAEVFDHVRITPRHGGFKVRFQKDRPLRDITIANIISEGPPRWLLSEPLAYELFRRSGVPAPLAEHIRLWQDGRLIGHQLLIEQPNKAFLTRNGRDDSGNLYKLLWYGQGVVEQHEKKTNLSSGHDDLLQLIDGLNKHRGAAQWEYIRQQFNVEEVANYFAVNMCLSNWDGFFNNYFAYHDLNGTGKWEMYPWDEDKTWGDYDGASSSYDWYQMPLTFGMKGDRPQRSVRNLFGGGPWGGTSWWRPPGHFSGPLLANPEFREKFLGRLNELCTTVFTEAKFTPIIRAMELRLTPEVRISSEAHGEVADSALRQFKRDVESFYGQVANRRKFILAELAKSAR